MKVEFDEIKESVKGRARHSVRRRKNKTHGHNKIRKLSRPESWKNVLRRDVDMVTHTPALEGENGNFGRKHMPLMTQLVAGENHREEGK